MNNHQHFKNRTVRNVLNEPIAMRRIKNAESICHMPKGRPGRRTRHWIAATLVDFITKQLPKYVYPEAMVATTCVLLASTRST